MGKDNFEKELDIFANFFIDALIEKSAVDRQLAAIDSEFDLRKVLGLILISWIFYELYYFEFKTFNAKKEALSSYNTIRKVLFEKNHL